MTEAFADQLIAALARRGRAAWFEPPGIIAVTPRVLPVEEWHWAFGTANDTWCGELTHSDGRSLSPCVTDIASTSEDVEGIAEAIIDHMFESETEELWEEE
jgi:hypothetical protein